MFGILGAFQKYRIGIEVSEDGPAVGVVLDSQGQSVAIHDSTSLPALLSELPVKGNVVSVAPAFQFSHFKTVKDLDEVCLRSLQFAAEVYLPYNISEASFTWRPLGQHRAAVGILTKEEVEALARLIRSHKPSELWVEPVEFAHARLGQAVFVSKSKTFQLTLSSQETISSLRQTREWLSSGLGAAMSAWKGPPPQQILGATSEVVEITGIRSGPLAPHAVARELAQGPAGPHRLLV
ncbi:hypothetical protein IV102_10095 [bacterium]|nr:hypothetical protein [bacterium]